MSGPWRTMQDVADHQRQMDELRDRVRTALDPQTEQERSIANWLANTWDEETLRPLAEMVERLHGQIGTGGGVIG